MFINTFPLNLRKNRKKTSLTLQPSWSELFADLKSLGKGIESSISKSKTKSPRATKK